MITEDAAIIPIQILQELKSGNVPRMKGRNCFIENGQTICLFHLSYKIRK